MTHVFQETIELETRGHGDMHRLDEPLQDILERSGIRQGLLHVFNIGSTGAVGTIEFEPGLQHDFPRELDRLIPPERAYRHEQTWNDANGHSHIQATLLGPSLTVPVQDGRMVLGTWQQVFHVECDTDARRRRLFVTVMGIDANG